MALQGHDLGDVIQRDEVIPHVRMISHMHDISVLVHGLVAVLRLEPDVWFVDLVCIAIVKAVRIDVWAVSEMSMQRWVDVSQVRGDLSSSNGRGEHRDARHCYSPNDCT